MSIVLAIAPVFAVMVLGHILGRGGLPDQSFWPQADRLVYWVLMPVLLFHMNSTVSFTGEMASGFAIVLVAAFYGVALLTFLACRLFEIAPPVTSTILQGALRHNSFIALAICESLYGQEGLEMATLAMSILALVTNVSIVPMLIGLLPKPPGMSVRRRVLRDTVRNPIILGIFSGLAVNLFIDGPIPGLHDATGLVGRAALPLMLLCVGASISFSGARGKSFPLLLSMAGKFVVFPSFVIALATWLSLDGPAVVVLLVFGAISTANAGLVLARQLGGDAPLMSTIIAVQTTACFVTLPIWILTLQYAQNAAP